LAQGQRQSGGHLTQSPGLGETGDLAGDEERFDS
ncbi:MAG: hypothetical protein JWQ55_1678, partial [Rhodopila sp.]|nr:hypothetical protein [Rhodopila sp.]